MRMKLKKLKRKSIRPKAQVSKLKEDEIKDQYCVAVRNRYEMLEEELTGEQQWDKLCEALVHATNEVVPEKERTMR